MFNATLWMLFSTNYWDIFFIEIMLRCTNLIHRIPYMKVKLYLCIETYIKAIWLLWNSLIFCHGRIFSIFQMLSVDFGKNEYTNLYVLKCWRDAQMMWIVKSDCVRNCVVFFESLQRLFKIDCNDLNQIIKFLFIRIIRLIKFLFMLENWISSSDFQRSFKFYLDWVAWKPSKIFLSFLMNRKCLNPVWERSEMVIVERSVM